MSKTVRSIREIEAQWRDRQQASEARREPVFIGSRERENYVCIVRYERLPETKGSSWHILTVYVRRWRMHAVDPPKFYIEIPVMSRKEAVARLVEDTLEQAIFFTCRASAESPKRTRPIMRMLMALADELERFKEPELEHGEE